MAVTQLADVTAHRKEVARMDRAIKRHIENANDVDETLQRLEERFRETIGLLRALEEIAEANTVGTIAQVSKVIRRDYKALQNEFMKLASRCSTRVEKNHRERENLAA